MYSLFQAFLSAAIRWFDLGLYGWVCGGLRGLCFKSYRFIKSTVNRFTLVVGVDKKTHLAQKSNNQHFPSVVVLLTKAQKNTHANSRQNQQDNNTPTAPQASTKALHNVQR